MEYIFILIMLLAVCFGGVLLFGAPYLPTLNKPKEKALDLLDLKKGQTLLELGSGDGRVLVSAAKRGINAVGIELNPVMFLISIIVTLRYRKKVKIIWGNFWSKPWPEADGVFVFLLDKYMSKFNQKMLDYPKKPVKVASFAFKIPEKKPSKEADGVFLYLYR